MPRQYVHIENPLPGTRDECTVERARRYKRDNRVEFVAVDQHGDPMVIRFLNTPLQAFVEKQAEDGKHEKLLATLGVTRGGYDRIDSLFHDASRHIPVINAEKMIREVKSSRNWSYTTAVDRTMRRAHSATEVALIRRGPIKPPMPSVLAACAGAR